MITHPNLIKQLYSDQKITHVFDLSVPKYQKSEAVEHFWSTLNQDYKITSKTRDQRKVFSITAFAIHKACYIGIPAEKFDMSIFGDIGIL